MPSLKDLKKGQIVIYINHDKDPRWYCKVLAEFIRTSEKNEAWLKLVNILEKGSAMGFPDDGVFLVPIFISQNEIQLADGTPIKPDL
jgi:alpha-galactosidase/6-phospho-beta-glucosidase family protein